MIINQLTYDDNFERCKVTITIDGHEAVWLNNALREYIVLHDMDKSPSEGINGRSNLRADLFILTELLNHGCLDGWAAKTSAAIRDRTAISSTTESL